MDITMSLAERFARLAEDFDLTGHELARRTLEAVPEPIPERQLSGVIERGVGLLGSRPALVRACGYKNVAKGLRRLDAWSTGREFPNDAQLAALSTATGEDAQELSSAVEYDRTVMLLRATKARAQTPAFILTVRLIPAVYRPSQLSPELTLRGALEKACETAGLRKCLALPTGQCVYISGTGTLEAYSNHAPSGGITLDGRTTAVAVTTENTVPCSKEEA
jgi:hypothetical protein